MLTTLKYCSLIFISSSALASGSYDDLAAKIGSFVSQTDCQKIGSSRAVSDQNPVTCSAVLQQKFSPGLFKINSQIIYQRLAAEEMKALECSSERWNDLGSKAVSDPVIENIKQRIDAGIPELKALQASIAQFSTANLNPTLAIKNDNTLTGAEKTKKIIAVKQAFDGELIKLQEAYELQLAKIPLSNNPIMKKYIESKFSATFDKLELAKVSEIKKVIADVNARLKEDKAEIKKSAYENNFSSSLEEKLIDNSEHIFSLLKETPDIAPTLFKLQCNIENRAKGKIAIETGASAVTFAIGGTAFALAKAARLAVLASDVERTLTAASWARSLTYVANSLGAAQSVQYIVKKCTHDIKLSKASCKVSLESFKENEQMTSCLQAGAIAAGLTFGSPILNSLKENSEWAKFLLRFQSKMAQPATGVEGRAFADLSVWQQYFQKEARLGIKYPPGATMNPKIIPRPQTAKPIEN